MEFILIRLCVIVQVQTCINSITGGNILKVTDLLQRIVNAVLRQEGEPPTAHNPGNLVAAPWLSGPVPMLGRFWYPATRNEGIAGLAHLVALHVAEGNTLRDFISGHPGVYAGFAPGADGNNDAAYIANVCAWAAIPDPDVPLWQYIDQVITPPKTS